MTILVLQQKESDRLVTRHFSAIEGLCGLDADNENNHHLWVAQLRYLFKSELLTKEADSWSLAASIFTRLVRFRQSQTTMNETGLPPEWGGVALCTLMEVVMLRTSDFRGISGLSDTVISGLRTGGKKMSVGHMTALSQMFCVPAVWFMEGGVTSVFTMLKFPLLSASLKDRCAHDGAR